MPVAVATRFVVSRWRDVPAFVRASTAAAEDAQRIRGLLQGQLLALFHRREFWTLTVWSDGSAVRRYGESSKHAYAMSRTDDWAEIAQIDRWKMDGSALPDFADVAVRFAVTPPRSRLRVLRVLQPLPPRGVVIDRSAG